VVVDSSGRNIEKKNLKVNPFLRARTGPSHSYARVKGFFKGKGGEGNAYQKKEQA
jgi:hypothetical protein